MTILTVAILTMAVLTMALLTVLITRDRFLYDELAALHALLEAKEIRKQVTAHVTFDLKSEPVRE